MHGYCVACPENMSMTRCKSCWTWLGVSRSRSTPGFSASISACVILRFEMMSCQRQHQSRIAYACVHYHRPCYGQLQAFKQLTHEFGAWDHLAHPHGVQPVGIC